MTGSLPLAPVCMFTVAALSSLLLLSSQTAPLSIRVDDLSRLDADLHVRVYGVVASVTVWDDGSAKLLLADHISGSTAIVRLEHSPERDFAGLVHIGDMIRVEGRAASGDGKPVIYASAGSAEILTLSEHSLSVDFLCDNWLLFQHDRFRITGVLACDCDSGATRLTNAQGDRSIRADCELVPAPLMEGTPVTAECTLLMDETTLALFLKVWELTPASQ